jgi:hypothetical protein
MLSVPIRLVVAPDACFSRGSRQTVTVTGEWRKVQSQIPGGQRSRDSVQAVKLGTNNQIVLFQ